MKYFNYVWILFTVIVMSINVYADTLKQEEKMVKDRYFQWCSSIAKAQGDSAMVTKYYAPDAILLPTLSQEILSAEGKAAYFKKLTSHENIKCVPEKLITRMYKNTAINTGFYKFTYTKNGKTVTVPARFTFIYKKLNNEWMIIKHHSSKMPD